MSEIQLAVELREAYGKGVARKLRSAGRVPAVLYGHDIEATPLSVVPSALEQLLRGHGGMNTLIDLAGDPSISGKTVIVKELQRDPVRGTMLHADFYAIDVNARISVSVPVHLEGTPEGVTLGGLLDHALREVELDCLPRAIPDFLSIDVSALLLGESLHVSDLALPAGVELKTDGSLSVASIVAPRVEEEAEAPELEEGEVPAEGEAAPEEGASAGEAAEEGSG